MLVIGKTAASCFPLDERDGGTTVLKSYLDIEAIRTRLSVPAVLAWAGFPVVRGRAVCPVPGPCSGKAGNSLAVYDDGARWHCFRCGSGGDVFTLLQVWQGLSVAASFRRAAAMVGITPGRIPSASRHQCSTNDPSRERQRILGEVFRTTAAIRDWLEGLSILESQSVDLRASALVGVVICNGKLDLMLSGDESAVEALLAEFEGRA